MVEQRAVNSLVVGSNPTLAAIFYASVAQLVEHLSEKQGVAGSTPA